MNKLEKKKRLMAKKMLGVKKEIKNQPKKRRLPGFVADSYLATAKILLERLIEYIEKNKPIEEGSSPHHLLYPAIFCFKHGAELWLKNIQLIVNKKPNDKTHDIIELTKFLAGEISIGETKNRLQAVNHLKIIMEIMFPYYTGSYLGADNKKPDINNEAERFPQSKNLEVYCPADYLSFKVEDNNRVKKIAAQTLNDIKSFKEQIMDLFSVIRS